MERFDRCPFFIMVQTRSRVYRLHHHDSGIDEDTDRTNEGKERYDVERIPRVQQSDECNEERERYRKAGDQCLAPTYRRQEKEHNARDCFQTYARELLQALTDLLRRVV